jgi:hypothetical protein
VAGLPMGATYICGYIYIYIYIYVLIWCVYYYSYTIWSHFQ